MKNYFFSPTTNGFYTENIHSTMPDDAVPVTHHQRSKILADIANGYEIRLIDGDLVSIAKPIDVSGLLESVKTQMRTTRAPMLDALTGIAGRAQRAGNTALAAEADALAEALLDITDDPALNAATTLQDMQAAGLAAYRAIAATASAELAVVFREITGV